MSLFEQNIEMRDSVFKTHKHLIRDSYDENGVRSLQHNVIKLKDFNKGFYNTMIGDKKMFDAGFNTLYNQLALLETTPVKPKYYFTYGFDLPIKVGGGFVDAINQFEIDWAGLNQVNLFNNQGNVIPRVNAGMTQKEYKTFIFEVAYDLKYIEMQKLERIQYMPQSITDIYAEVISVLNDKFNQEICYFGIAEAGTTGLFNSPNVMINNVPVGVSGKNAGLKDLTTEENIAFVNGIIAETLINTSFNVKIIPDTILMPLKDFTVLSNTTSDISFGKNLYNYLIENNVATDMAEVQGFKLKIKARPDLDTIGLNENGRVVAYRNEEEFVRVHLTQPLKAILSMPNIERAAETTIFASQISEVQLPYNKSSEEQGIVSYWDFGA